ncbi:MAG: prolyl oligopeptidase family serine peptidase [Candidatus Marinimicrobia bacterium]|nr:prolyl oligopeptidase family serine peptidase [Candidatus Neomarinimicrobiota bacterium]
MNVFLSLLAILFFIGVIRYRSVIRTCRQLMFGFSILTDGQSRFINYLTPGIDCLDTTYTDSSNEQALRIYQPRNRSKPLPAAIIYHGASPKGISHPAMNLLAKNLARLGIRVFLPELPKLKELSFSPDTYPRLMRFFHQIVVRPDVLPDKILLVGVSFSGGMVVKVSTEPDINPIGVISFGSYFNLAETMRYFFTGQAEFNDTKIDLTPHEYTKAVWFGNYLHQLDLPFETEQVYNCIGHFLREEKAQVETTYLKCNPQQRDFLKQVFDPRDKALLPYLDLIEPKIRETIESISPHKFIDRIKSPLFIVHGVRDNMVPYTQALAFCAALEEKNKTYFQYIMRIYAHSKAGGSTIFEFISEMKALFGLLNNLLKVLE